MTLKPDMRDWNSYQPGAACPLCKMPRSPEGHDPCIRNLPGVRFACCGHGVEHGYVYFENGVCIRMKVESVEQYDPKVEGVALAFIYFPSTDDDKREWQPIVTAPKDGQIVLVYDPTAASRTHEAILGLACPAAWVDRVMRKTIRRGGWFRKPVVQTWREAAWEIAAPRRDLARWTTIANAATLNPTHWMPLPAAPSACDESVDEQL